MAILISKSKAQNKGAMTLKPFANSTFIASLFILEDTMTTEKSKKAYSRMKARKLWKQTYSELPKDIIVHHKDLNPFNNNIENLGLMDMSKHIAYHASISKAWGRKQNLEEQFDKLERWLVLFNDR